MNWTLEQLKAFVQAVEAGSFSAAARKLGKAQSRVSESIANLEVEFNVQLFDRSARIPQLTEAGEALHRQALTVLAQCDMLTSQAASVAAGLEAKLVLTIDEGAPTEAIQPLFQQVPIQFPNLQLTVIHATRGDVLSAIDSGRAQLGLVQTREAIPQDMQAKPIGHSEYVLVVSAEHPLADLSELNFEALRRYRQFVICDINGQPFDQPISPDYWLMNSYFSALPLLSLRQGWALMPRPILDSGWYVKNLVARSVEQLGIATKAPMAWVHRRDASIGPVMRYIMQTV